MLYVLATLLLVVIGAYMLSYGSKPPKGVERISEDQLKELLDRGGILYDVRTNTEFIMGHIPKGINNPFEKGQLTKELPEEKSEIIICYCKSGRRAMKAEKYLLDLGYKKVYDFGAISHWNGELIEKW